MENEGAEEGSMARLLFDGGKTGTAEDRGEHSGNIVAYFLKVGHDQGARPHQRTVRSAKAGHVEFPAGPEHAERLPRHPHLIVGTEMVKDQAAEDPVKGVVGGGEARGRTLSSLVFHRWEEDTA